MSGRSDTEHLISFAVEVGGRVAHILQGGIPDEARHHLLNAQRELISALVIIYEHQSRRGASGRSSGRAGRGAAAWPGADAWPVHDRTSASIDRADDAGSPAPRKRRASSAAREEPPPSRRIRVQ